MGVSFYFHPQTSQTSPDIVALIPHMISSPNMTWRLLESRWPGQPGTKPQGHETPTIFQEKKPTKRAKRLQTNLALRLLLKHMPGRTAGTIGPLVVFFFTRGTKPTPPKLHARFWEEKSFKVTLYIPGTQMTLVLVGTSICLFKMRIENKFQMFPKNNMFPKYVDFHNDLYPKGVAIRLHLQLRARPWKK